MKNVNGKTEETVGYYDIDASAVIDGQEVRAGPYLFVAVVKEIPLPNGEYLRIAGVAPKTPLAEQDKKKLVI